MHYNPISSQPAADRTHVYLNLSTQKWPQEHQLSQEYPLAGHAV
jgi:hypothetical protein